ncbi:DUF6801 domain-containing protein [Streptomyces sp. NPDC057963]|uniref:DUF6801 domain-containing protein n=1 Tax=Streptomyces sp. NPDC057963 TaxID=3346290 RepID=UPI0036EAD435
MASDKLIQNLRERHRTSRAVPSGPVARRALGLTMAVGVAGASVGVFGAGSAAADPVSLKLRYTCSVPVFSDRPGTVRIDSDVPKSVGVDKPTSKFAIRAAVPVNAADTRGLRKAGIKIIKGTVEVKVRVTAPEGDTNLRLTFHAARTNVPESGPFLVKMTGVAPRLTFSQPGRAKITVGDLIMHVTASGGMTVKLDVPCRLDTAQNNVVALLDITGPRATTGPTPSKTPDTAASGTTGSQNPSGGARAGATTEGSAGPSGSLATTGSQGTMSLIPLVAGTVVLGTLAVAAAFRFRSRNR